MTTAKREAGICGRHQVCSLERQRNLATAVPSPAYVPTWILLGFLTWVQQPLTGQSARPTEKVVIGGTSRGKPALENPRAIVLTPNGVVVGEAGSPHLKLFSLTGALRHSTGRDGAGPGEVRFVSALAFDSAASRLVVFDAANRRAQYYDVNDDSLRFTGTDRYALPVSAGCFVRGKFYVLASHPDGMLHELRDSSGMLIRVRSFPWPPIDHQLSTHPLFRNQIAKGVLHCNEHRGELVAGSYSTGIVQIISLQQGSSRSFVLTRFKPLIFQLADGGLKQRDPEDHQKDELVGILPLVGG